MGATGVATEVTAVGTGASVAVGATARASGGGPAAAAAAAVRTAVVVAEIPPAPGHSLKSGTECRCGYLLYGSVGDRQCVCAVARARERERER